MAARWEMNYRGFDVYFSTINNAYNAKPTDVLKALHPDCFPMAMNTTEEVMIMINAQIERLEEDAEIASLLAPVTWN